MNISGTTNLKAESEDCGVSRHMGQLLRSSASPDIIGCLDLTGVDDPKI